MTKLLTKPRRVVASLFVAGAVATGIGAPAAVAQPIVTGGLVNVVVNDVELLNDVNLGVALNVAANLCDVNVNVLAQQFRAGGAQCENDDQVVRIEQA